MCSRIQNLESGRGVRCSCVHKCVVMLINKACDVLNFFLLFGCVQVLGVCDGAIQSLACKRRYEVQKQTNFKKHSICVKKKIQLFFVVSLLL